MNCLVSVIVPIYNVEEYLPRCIDSLVNQTYKNVEVILVDDGSLDRCGEICEKYAAQDNRIKVIHKQNGGLSDARNAGLNIAKGDYILFVDSDDWLEKNACETVLRHAINSYSDVVVFGIRTVFENGNVINSKVELNGNISKEKCIQALIYRVVQNGINNYAWNKLFSRKLFDRIRFPQKRLAEDQAVTYRLFHNAQRIFVCGDNLYNYYQRSSSITGGGQYRPQLIKDRHILWMERLEFLKKHYPNLVDYQIAQILGVVYVSLIKLKNDADYADFRKELLFFAEKSRMKAKQLARYDRKVKLHYYCYPLFWIYVKLYMK